MLVSTGDRGANALIARASPAGSVDGPEIKSVRQLWEK